MPRKQASHSSASTCSKCGCTKNPSGYCPTCYQIKRYGSASDRRSATATDSYVHLTDGRQLEVFERSNGSCYYHSNGKEITVRKNQRVLSSHSRDSSSDDDWNRWCSPWLSSRRSFDSGYVSNDSIDLSVSSRSYSLVPASPPKSVRTKIPSSCNKRATTPSKTAQASYLPQQIKQPAVKKAEEPIHSTSPSTKVSPLTKHGTDSKSPDTTSTQHTSITTASKPSSVTTQSSVSDDQKIVSSKNSATAHTKEGKPSPINTTDSVQASTIPPAEMELLGRETQDWRDISQRVFDTMPQAKIQSIHKINNAWLMERYQFAKKRMAVCNSGKVNEKLLFHGTTSVPPSKIINSEFGFDFRCCSKGLWGIGTYFAVNASYSNAYSYKPAGQAHREILLALVLTGDSYRCTHDESLRRPPVKKKQGSPMEDSQGRGEERYDTVCGHTGGSDVFVVYDHEKAYPNYLITYTTQQSS